MGRKCAVPHCYTGYRKCTEKAALYKVPDDDFFLSKWQEAIAREDRPINPKDYVCEKHFKDDDILRKRIRKDVVENYQRPRLKPDAIPSIFPDLPEFILKMTKKRRKLNVPVSNDMTVNDQEKVVIPLDIKEELEDDKKENGVSEIDNDEIEIKTEIEEVNSPSTAEIDEYDPTGAKLHQCDICSYKTKFSHNLRTHKVKHLSGEDAYMICEFCMNYKTKWEITYVNHMKSKHGIILKECFKCPFCTFKTKNKFFFTKHCENEHDNEEIKEKTFKCEFDGCGYKTESEALLNIHSLTHDNFQVEKSSNIRVFTCKECAFKSNCKGTLETHVKSCHKADNTEEVSILKSPKPELFCKECYFKTNTKNALTKHVNSAHNTGAIEETPKLIKKTLVNHTPDTEKQRALHTEGVLKQKAVLKCSRCPYKSHSEAMLEKHLSKHQMLLQTNAIQQTNRLQCTKCSFVTFSESSLEDHQKNSFHCVECTYVTKNKSEHIIHTLTHRNVSVEEVRNTSLEGSSSSSNKTNNDINTAAAADFCVVTIKEERDDLSMEQS